MKICEGCIKQDVCKFKGEVEGFEKKHKAKLPEMLTENLECRYRKLETVNCPTVWTDTTFWHPDQWTYTSADTYILASN